MFFKFFPYYLWPYLTNGNNIKDIDKNASI